MPISLQAAPDIAGVPPAGPGPVRMNREPAVRQGVVVAVRGSVVDMRFDGGLPAIHFLPRAGDGGRVAIEALAQRDARLVRGIALSPTQGLARGIPVADLALIHIFEPTRPYQNSDAVFCLKKKKTHQHKSTLN